MKRINVRASLESVSTGDQEELLVDNVDHEETLEALESLSVASKTLTAMKNTSPDIALEHYNLYRAIAASDVSVSLEAHTSASEAIVSMEGIVRSSVNVARELVFGLQRSLGSLTILTEAKVQQINSIARDYKKLLNTNRITDKVNLTVSGGFAKKFTSGKSTDIIANIKRDQVASSFMLSEYPINASKHEAALLKGINQMVRDSASVNASSKLAKEKTPAETIPKNYRSGGEFMQMKELRLASGSWEEFSVGIKSPKIEYGKTDVLVPTFQISADQKQVQEIVNTMCDGIDILVGNTVMYTQWAIKTSRALNQVANALSGMLEGPEEMGERLDLVKTMVGNSYRNTRTNSNSINHAYSSIVATSKLVDKLIR